ncbi:MAG TPA: DUF58 domain-containing protein [Casimicrobiaceae bacterium]|nr:DUF58 domain-containing protein [Casimicrobiaceae bacterium]
MTAQAAVRGWFAQKRARLLRHAPDDGTRVVLAHSRIYILPTRRGLALIATLAIMLVTSMNYGLALGFIATFVLTGWVGAALLNTFRNLAGLAMQPGSAGEAFAGESVPFSLTLVAGARTRVAIELSAVQQPPAFVDVEAGASAPVSLAIVSSARGHVPLGRVTIASSFPLGLWRGWAYTHFPMRGIAYPLPELSAPPLPTSIEGYDAASRSRIDDGDLTGLRSFQRGDPLQRVAWKAVARGAGWHTKAFEGAQGGGPVVLDLRALPAALAIEHKLSRLTAWVLDCERAARPYALVIPPTHIVPSQGRDQRRAVLTALALYDKST